MATRGNQSKYWCYTINNPQPGDNAGLSELSDYHVVGNEVGEDGTPHYQGFIIMKNRIRLTGMKKHLPRAHLEAMKGTPQQASDYCKKEDDYVEEGILPAITKGKRKDLDEFAADCVQKNDKELFEEWPGHFLRFNSHVEKVRNKVAPAPATLEERCGIWIWGPTHTGKSQMARGMGSFFDKNCNKWWDGYAGEDVVIIDDLDRTHDWMAQNLKRWADIYPFHGETKGGMIHIRPQKLVVTSNYSIEEVFKYGDIKPIVDRFKVIETKFDENFGKWEEISIQGSQSDLELLNSDNEAQ